APVFQTGQAGSIPAGHSRGSANGRPAVFEAAHEGSTPSPRTSRCLRFAHGTTRARNVNQDACLGRQSADHPGLKRGMLWVQLLPDGLWPVGLLEKDTSPSRWKDGFDSHTGYWN